MSQNRSRVMTEIMNLADLCEGEYCEAISYDLDDGTVALKNYQFPGGWQPATSHIVFDLPDTYPNQQPTVYLREELEYHGGRPRIKMATGPDGWSKYCIHRIRDWEPQRHTLATLIRMIDNSLHDPNSTNPLQ